MCVGLPAKVRKVKGGTAVIDAGGAVREVSAELIENLEPGDFVMVHAGSAIAKITSDDEQESDQILEELGI
ncbi:MAG: HypC/HybG/HupF family hydrogenase formation chaperone [Eubacteriales bacterium]|nr:HypC/HybG/HupF family hydrogenase formation chaperone [Eubacteriales bacterium]